MSENLDLVRSIYAAWECGDFSSAEWADPNIELTLADGPDAWSRRGLRAMASAWREFLGAWTDYCVQADEYHDLGDGRVLVVVNAFGRGRSSGAEIGATSQRGANVFEIRAGKVARFTIYFDRDRALADLGLEE